MAELVLGRPFDLGDPVAVDAWLARNGVVDADADALRSDATRLGVYRGLVRGRLREAVELALPRFRARMGALFDEYFERYLADRGPRSHQLRDVTTELLDFMAPLVASDPRVPPWALELGRHESLDVLVGSLADSPSPGALPDLDPERGLVFTATARVVRTAFAVHQLSDDPADRREPERIPTALFVYRGPEHDVRYLEVTPLAAEILERLLAGRSLRSTLAAATSALGLVFDDAVLEGTARLLADLAERGAVTGARPSTDAAGDLQNPAEPAENARARSAPKGTE
ncbi:MAG TPA: putative DNA-binding domain-containing protein [Polyangiaceae bacterium]|nr:putative DNA-binding domain-containing protein [Polyangiaceae bacterium]